MARVTHGSLPRRAANSRGFAEFYAGAAVVVEPGRMSSSHDRRQVRALGGPRSRSASWIGRGFWASVLGATIAGGCGSSAEGIETCRRIERARCRAAAACGLIEDAVACERFYRDQCLHGVAADVPTRPVVETCVEAIDAARECASTEPDPTRTCADGCALVARPERSEVCSFLSPEPYEPPDPSEGGAGSDGSGGEGGEPAGAGGTSAD